MADKKLNLMLHSGGQEVELNQVYGVETPSPTDTWFPISHALMIQSVMSSLKASGLAVVDSVHGLWGEGARYFGLMQIQPLNEDFNEDYNLVLGLRNSHDKAFRAGLAIGAGVFVCDNLSFSSEVEVGRKHTRFIQRDLPSLVTSAVGQIGALRHSQDKRIKTYSEHDLTDVQAHDFIIRALKQGIISTARIQKTIQEWEAPSYDHGDKTAFRLFNAFTEALKPKPRNGNRDNNNLLSLPKTTQKLHGLMDQQCGLIVDGKVNK